MTFELAKIEDLLEDMRLGRMCVLVDDEDRENEGDLIVAASVVTPEHINFMATHGRGLICLAMSAQEIDRLSLPLMTDENDCRLGTAFTVSIDAKQGVTTGISAHDRAHTIRVASHPNSTRAELQVPGHIFPLRAREGGVIERAGHTEASVEMARLVGLGESAVICEIMKDDGTMMRLPDLLPYAQKHGLKIGSIEALRSYLLTRESQAA